MVELLVVIAILMVLAALVFSLASKARKAAQGSVCLNNMRQIAADQVALCNENGGVIVHANRTAIKNGPARSWRLHHTILRNEDFSWNQRARDVQTRVETMTHLQCPTAYTLQKDKMDSLSGHSKVCTYSMNGLVGSDFDPDSGTHPWIKGARTLSSIQNAATFVMLIEKEAFANGNYGDGAGPAAEVHVFARFHGGGFNVAFYDGHVERGKHGEFPINTKPGFAWGNEEFKTYWYGTEHSR